MTSRPKSLKLSRRPSSVTSMKLSHDLLFKRIGMATGGTIMAPGDKLNTSRDKLGIQGQSLLTSRSQDGSLSVPSSEASPTVSRPSTATSVESPVDGISSISMPPEAVGVLETVINMNKALEQQIEALRMRLTVESKNHDAEKTHIIHEKEKVLNKKEDEINDLKDSLVRREERISALSKEGIQKDTTIMQKEKEIVQLKDLVKQTEGYAEQLQKRIGRLRNDNHKADSDTLSKEQNDDMKQLKKEIASMKDKIVSMEKELGRAKVVIEQQSTKIKGLEFEKGALSDKFKEELERASKAMRSEVERMREVMKQQYVEMRSLREQNIEISSDVRDIKDILLKGTIKPEPDIKIKTTEKLDVNNFKSPRPVTKSPNFGIPAPLTARQPSSSKKNATIRTSLPTMSRETLHTRTQGFPPISKDDPNAAKWTHIANTNKHATLHTRSTKGRRK
ncbi:hypothetical protein ACF0H5_005112 [Mactra antiquata]